MTEQEYQLVVRKGPRVGEVFHLDARLLIVGRDPMSDIVINDPEISRQHVRLSQTESGFQLEDLGSTNGTFVDGQRLESEPLQLLPGQSVNMGSGVRVVYEVAGTDHADVATRIDMESSLPADPEIGEVVEMNTPASGFRSVPPLDDDFPPAFSSPEPEPYMPGSASSERPLVPAGNGNSNNKRIMIIAVVAILLFCCACAFIGFMYQWGGDYLLDYFS